MKPFIAALVLLLLVGGSSAQAQPCFVDIYKINPYDEPLRVGGSAWLGIDSSGPVTVDPLYGVSTYDVYTSWNGYRWIATVQYRMTEPAGRIRVIASGCRVEYDVQGERAYFPWVGAGAWTQ